MNKIDKRQEIGRRIAHLRTACGFTQRQLAAKCNLEQSHIARIERGKFRKGSKDRLRAQRKSVYRMVSTFAPSYFCLFFGICHLII